MTLMQSDRMDKRPIPADDALNDVEDVVVTLFGDDWVTGAG